MKKFLFPCSLAAIVLALDLLTKEAVRESLALYQRIEIIPGFFNLVHVLNKGAAFGFLASESIDWQTTFFVVTGWLAVAVILYLIHSGQAADRFGSTGLGLLLGGALGNLVDRMTQIYVTDFLDFYIGTWHWPAFNVADIGICCGVGLLMVSFYITERRIKRQRNARKTAEDA